MSNPSTDYPMGDSVEIYDIEIEKELEINDEILKEYHADYFTEIFDDDLPDHFDDWVQCLTRSEIKDIVQRSTLE